MSNYPAQAESRGGPTRNVRGYLANISVRCMGQRSEPRALQVAVGCPSSIAAVARTSSATRVWMRGANQQDNSAIPSRHEFPRHFPTFVQLHAKQKDVDSWKDSGQDHALSDLGQHPAVQLELLHKSESRFLMVHRPMQLNSGARIGCGYAPPKQWARGARVDT
jgi:hypothetical protein